MLTFKENTTSIVIWYQTYNVTQNMWMLYRYYYFQCITLYYLKIQRFPVLKIFIDPSKRFKILFSLYSNDSKMKTLTVYKL